MKVLLDGLLPRLVPGLPFMCVPHEGKQDLEKSLPRKLRAWRTPGTRFVVIRDNDSGDCRTLKGSLSELCQVAQRPDTLVRIACQELESWYLAEPEALAKAFGKDNLKNIRKKASFRDPDGIPKPSAALRRLVPGFQKVSGARAMAGVLSRDRNTSCSFQVLLSGLDRLRVEMNV